MRQDIIWCAGILP